MDAPDGDDELGNYEFTRFREDEVCTLLQNAYECAGCGCVSLFFWISLQWSLSLLSCGHDTTFVSILSYCSSCVKIWGLLEDRMFLNVLPSAQL